MKKLAYLVIVALLISESALSQNTATSRLVDKFQDASCENLWARLDYFNSELSKTPNASATVAISGKIGELGDDLWIEDMIRGYFLRTRRMPSEQWKVVRLRPETARKIELWITPEDAEPPKLESTEWSLIYPKETKPFVFTYEPDHMEEVSVCLISNRLRLLAQVLAANPSARTNVVLIVRSQKEFLRKKRSTVADLTGYGIPMRQIRIFKRKSLKPDPFNIEPDVEFWFVPAKESSTS